ncbi:uncharacterized protein [Watersipora subatra]|uniref:uncharacterized protein n=1 Tax=Watersipora subatra TaxID=2589382 RepID=UPI00355B5C2B
MKDRKWRFCIDYRRLNAVTEQDAYPLPRINDSLDALSGTCYFRTLDLVSGYWQVPLDAEVQEKSAFSTQSGLWKWKVLPSTLPPSKESWNILHKAGIKLKPSKCKLLQPQVCYLGHIISQNGVSTDPNKVEAVPKWPSPRRVGELQGFLGTVGYYRQYISEFATIAHPLHRLTAKGEPWRWTEREQAAFDILNKSISTALILGYPDPRWQYILDTDTSGCAVSSAGGLRESHCLLQQDLHPLGMQLLCHSIAATCSSEGVQALMAVSVWARVPPVDGPLVPPVAMPEEETLKPRSLKELAKEQGLLATWVPTSCLNGTPALDRVGSTLDSVAYPEWPDGNPHGTPAPTVAELSLGARCFPEGLSAPPGVTGPKGELAKTQATGQESLAIMYPAIATGEQVPAEQLRSGAESWTSCITCRVFCAYDKTACWKHAIWCAICPPAMRETTVWQSHTLAHSKIGRTIGCLQLTWYWPGQTSTVWWLIKSCEVCQAAEHGKKKGTGGKRRLYAERPLQKVAVDLVGPFPVAPRGTKPTPPHSATGETANMLMLGRELRLPDHLECHSPPTKFFPALEHALKVQQRLQTTHEALRRSQMEVRQEDKEKPLL